ncbi:hypothetical protein [Armatimonas sp.]|uniref:hypothetical protein n=1 Tax=Armatimonas sp. TaxID=1872638 RepID=UPI00374DB018
MARFLRYTTFQPGELEGELKALALKNGVVADVPNAWDVRRHNPLHHRWHDCTILYPDGTSGTCHYTRQGPKWHIFRYQYGGDQLPYAYHMDELGRDATSIEALAQEKAAVAFEYAICEEQRLAKRIQPPQGRKGDPAKYQIPIKRLKLVAGKYALCAPLADKLLPAAFGLYDTLEQANTAWQERGNPTLVIAIACRWTRRWERLRFNINGSDLMHSKK